MFGMMLRMIPNPLIVLLVRIEGVEFFMLDVEYGLDEIETVEYIFKEQRAHGMGYFVRITELSRGYVSRVTYTGANGTIVPMVQSPDQVQMLACCLKYEHLNGRNFGRSGGHTSFDKIIVNTATFS